MKHLTSSCDARYVSRLRDVTVGLRQATVVKLERVLMRAQVELSRPISGFVAARRRHRAMYAVEVGLDAPAQKR